MKHILVLFYIVAVLLGGLIIAVVNIDPEIQLVATRPISANELLRTGDLQLRVDGTRYLPHAVDANGIVAASDVRTLPGVVSNPVDVPISIEVSRDVVVENGIVPGSSVHVCPLDVQASVRVVFCGNRESACFVIAALSGPGDSASDGAEDELSIGPANTCE